MKKFVIILFMLSFVSPVFADDYQKYRDAMYKDDYYEDRTVVEVEENQFERGYNINSAPDYSAAKGVTYAAGNVTNYGSNISPKNNYATKSFSNYNTKSSAVRTYRSGPAYRLGK